MNINVAAEKSLKLDGFSSGFLVISNPENYGKTWWGQQWLNSLSKIDNSNRLSRGKTYAIKGLVKNIEIDTNTINAKVQGSAPRPYKVSVSVPLFNDKQKQELLNEILNNPAILAKLLNRELPEDLARFADRNFIPLFPKSWRDFPMKCSCPDFAVPCKHLASVIYITANEIDKNPFLVFQLHGFDVSNEVSSRYGSSKKSGIRVNALEEFFEENPPINEIIGDTIFEQIDFSDFEPMSEKLLKIIQLNPIFYEKDFKKNLNKAHKLIMKGADKWYPEQRNTISNFNFTDNLEIVINQFSKIKEIMFFDADYQSSKYEKATFDQIKNTFCLSDEKLFERMSDSFRIFKTTRQFCLKLLENGAIIPQLLKSNNDEYFVRWIPAMNNVAVRETVKLLSKAVPQNLILFEGKQKTLTQNPEEQLLTLCSIFLQRCVSFYTIPMGNFYRGKATFDRWNEFFFQQIPYTFSGFREKETPTAIQSWLNNYYISQRDFVPILRVEDDEEHGQFLLDVSVEGV